MNEIYQLIIKSPGCIFEFGSYLGQTTIIFENLRAVYEPYNHLRRIFTFDTFKGYVNIESENEITPVFRKIIDEKTYTVPLEYTAYLRELIAYHEAENVMSHIKKHTVIEGDEVKTLPTTLKSDPSILIALAYFDLAMFYPTFEALKTILPRMLKGSVIVLDELGHPDYPSETEVFLKLIAHRSYEIKRSSFLADRSFIILL